MRSTVLLLKNTFSEWYNFKSSCQMCWGLAAKRIQRRQKPNKLYTLGKKKYVWFFIKQSPNLKRERVGKKETYEFHICLWANSKMQWIKRLPSLSLWRKHFYSERMLFLVLFPLVSVHSFVRFVRSWLWFESLFFRGHTYPVINTKTNEISLLK